MSDKKLKFTAELLLAKKTATGFQVPDQLVEELGRGKKPPVKVTINGFTYPSTIAVMNNVFMLPVSADVRDKAKVRAGDIVEVQLELDDQPREIAIPDIFRSAIEKSPKAFRFFETLSNSNKKRIIIPIEEAKTEETRLRRIIKAIEDLEAGN